MSSWIHVFVDGFGESTCWDVPKVLGFGDVPSASSDVPSGTLHLRWMTPNWVSFQPRIFLLYPQVQLSNVVHWDISCAWQLIVPIGDTSPHTPEKEKHPHSTVAPHLCSWWRWNSSFHLLSREAWRPWLCQRILKPRQAPLPSKCGWFQMVKSDEPQVLWLGISRSDIYEMAKQSRPQSFFLWPQMPTVEGTIESVSATQLVERHDNCNLYYNLTD